MAINNKVDGEPDPTATATMKKAQAMNSKSGRPTQATLDLSRALNAGVKKATINQRGRNLHTFRPPTDHPVAANKRRSEHTSMGHSDGQEVAEENSMENGCRDVHDDEEGGEESREDGGDDYDLSSDEEWEDVKLMKRSLGSAVRQRNVFAVTFEQEVGAYVGEMSQTILGIYRDLHDANRAAQEHSRKQPYQSRHKERIYSDGTFHSRARGGQRERYNVDVSRVKYTERKK